MDEAERARGFALIFRSSGALPLSFLVRKTTMMLSSRGPASALASTSARSSSGAASAFSSARLARHAPAAKQQIPDAFSGTQSTPLTPATRPRPATATSALDNDTVLSAAAASADATQPIYDVNDPVITAVFSLATVALSVLTLGVAYLSITGWIDSRNEEAERKRVEAAERSRLVSFFCFLFFSFRQLACIDRWRRLRSSSQARAITLVPSHARERQREQNVSDV